jgi:hypothetical protein
MMALNPGRSTRGVVWFVPEGSVRGVLAFDEGLVVAEEAAFLGGADELPIIPGPTLADALMPELLALLSSCCAIARKSASDPSSK